MATLIQISERRNAMQQEMKQVAEKSAISGMQIPYSLAQRWIEIEREYQIKLANIESAKQAAIIKDLTEQVKDLKRGVRT